MPAQQQHHITTAFLSAGSIVRGQCAVLNEAGSGYVVATAANRTAEGRRTSGIALTSATATPGDNAFELQVVGEVPEDPITNLGAGTASLIRVSTTGILERVGSYSGSDDVCGYCDADGTAHVCFPLIGMSVVIGSGSAPGLPANSVQYYATSTTLGGAARVSIDPVAGNLQLGASAGPFASAGTVRKAAGVSDRWRSIANSRDVHGMLHTSGGGFGGGVPAGRDYVRFGDVNNVNWVDGFLCYARYGHEMSVINSSGVRCATMSVFGPSNWSYGHAATGVALVPNVYIGSDPFPMTVDYFNGNTQLVCIEGRDAAPTGNPVGRLCWQWYDRLTGKYWQRDSAGVDVELTNVAGTASDEANALAITATPAASLAVATYGHIDSHSTATTVNIYGLVAPTTGKAKRITIHNNNSDGATLVLKYESGSASAALDRFFMPDAADLTISSGETYVVTYSDWRGRWVVAKGAA